MEKKQENNLEQFQKLFMENLDEGLSEMINSKKLNSNFKEE